MARGIDGAAHEGALAANGRSVAVVATGIDRIYPQCHRGLAARLEREGCMVSEFAPGRPPLQHHFPRRNRLISGLSLGVLVVEAALPSGSLITARTALEQGREVFALPWSIFHGGGAGCLHVLRDGAKMVESFQDVIDELGPMYSLQQDLLGTQMALPELAVALSTRQRGVLEAVGFERVSADDLSELCGMSAGQLMAELSYLELHGLVTRAAGGYIRN
jgi:DNA processing protein